jgi:hypothetical protein
MTRQRPLFFDQIVESTRIIFGSRLSTPNETLKDSRHRASPATDFDHARSLEISARSSGDDLSSSTLEAVPGLSRG